MDGPWADFSNEQGGKGVRRGVCKQGMVHTDVVYISSWCERVEKEKISPCQARDLDLTHLHPRFLCMVISPLLHPRRIPQFAPLIPHGKLCHQSPELISWSEIPTAALESKQRWS